MRDPIIHCARRWTALSLLLASAACGGGGGAALPTEPGIDLPGSDNEGPTDPPPGDGGGEGEGGGEGGGGGGGGGGGQTPVTVTITVADDRGFSPSTVTIPVGSTVVWTMVDGHHDITFDGAAPAGGSIPDTDEEESASRTFDEPGTYSYHCDRHDDDGESGVIIVQAGTGGGDDPTDPGDPVDPPTTVVVRTPGDSFSPGTATVPAGGTVQWQISGDEHNVTFTGAAPPGGNIPDTDGQTVSRTFPEAGRYDYFCTRHSGMTGAVVVVQ